MEKELVNRVANSGLITINLEEFYPKEEILSFDLKDYLFRGLILREKDFREAMATPAHHTSAKFRVTAGSTGIPGPVVVETVTFLR
jgi:hypothetical protein